MKKININQFLHVNTNMSVSLDCWSLIVQFLSSKDRLSLLLSNSKINESCVNQPIWYMVKVFGERILAPEKAILLRSVKLMNWSDDCFNRFNVNMIVRLVCNSNELENIPELPNCEYLNCFDNCLFNLPSIPKMKNLDCSINNIQTLPELPNCKILDCSTNTISKLPALPKCEVLYCSTNLLYELPELPLCKELKCSCNNLTSLPKSLPQDAMVYATFNNIYTPF